MTEQQKEQARYMQNAKHDTRYQSAVRNVEQFFQNMLKTYVPGFQIETLKLVNVELYSPATMLPTTNAITLNINGREITMYAMVTANRIFLDKNFGLSVQVTNDVQESIRYVYEEMQNARHAHRVKQCLIKLVG